jgi:hypothetical protein
MMKNDQYLPGLIAILALFLITPVRLEALTFQAIRQRTGTISPLAWPARTTAHAQLQVMEADLNGDGQVERLRLDSGQALIEQGGLVTWSSPAEWQVAQASINDLDRDGRLEADLLVWRPFRPWPVDRFMPYGGRIKPFQDSQGRSCQIILIAWRNGAFQERWAGSALAEPLRSFAAADLDGDGRQELIGMETAYDVPLSSSANAISIWEWNGFGFSLLARRKGSYRWVAVYSQAGLEPFLVVQR